MKKSPSLSAGVPVWLFFLCLLVWALLLVAFGWAVQSKMSGSDKSGLFGKAAVEIARFPSKAKGVLVEISSLASGSYQDDQKRVRRDPNIDYARFTPLDVPESLGLQGLAAHVDRPALAEGWRVLIGAFRFGDRVEDAALLMSSDLKIVKVWRLDEAPIGDLEPRPAYRKFVHGFELLPDGSAVFTFDGSISLQRIDACGARLWGTAGNFHHAVTLDEAGQSVWTFNQDHTIAAASVADGRILQTISLEEMLEANPDIDILELRRLHENDLNGNSRNTVGRWLKEPIHFNDVDPLPRSMAARFGDFEAGDLLVSARSLNLIFVISPATKKIKWWRVGLTRRQHDPDWLTTGEISIFNNRMGEDFSEIIAVDPTTFRRRVLFDGRENAFYTRIRGKHQVLHDGRIIVTSSQQGRAFEVNPSGEVVLDLVNFRPGDAPFNYVISEMRWLPPDYFKFEDWACGLEK